MTSPKLRKKATKTKLDRKNPKGSIKRSLEPEEKEPTKRKTPQPPAPPKRRKRSQPEKPENPKEPSSGHPRAYLSPTPKVKASTSKEEAETPTKRKRVKASRKAALVEELPVAKSEPDYEPTEKPQGSKPAGVSEVVPAPATPDSSEDSSSDAKQHEPELKQMSAQLDSLRASTQAPARPPGGGGGRLVHLDTVSHSA